MSPKETTELDAIGERVRARLSAKHAARERAFQASRECILHCANAIRAVHRREFQAAAQQVEAARALLSRIDEALVEHEDLRHSGYAHDARKEYAEAVITLKLVSGQPVPSPEELGVGDAEYLNGLGEAAGELRRHMLDIIRSGDIARCEEVMAMLDDIYGLLVTVDLPDSITGGLKRTTDMVRGVLERTRGDFTLTLRQERLEEHLKGLEGRLGAG